MGLPAFDVLGFLLELFKGFCVLYTVTNLAAQHYRTKLLVLLHESSGPNHVGIMFFLVLSGLAMIFPIQLPYLDVFFFDLRLSVIILSTLYIGVADSFIVATATLVFRMLKGGLDWIWWAAGIYVYVASAYLIIKNIRSRNLGLFAASVVITALHLGLLAVLSAYHPGFNFVSPFVAADNFLLLAMTLLMSIPLSVHMLDLSLSRILAFQNQYSELQYKADTDGLTGLLNRRRFQELFSQLPALYPGKPLSVLMIDVDEFKKYNDTFGHPQGDVVLRRLAALLANNVRESDIVTRYGGEEFIIGLPNTAAQEAVRIAETIRGAIENTPFYGRQITVSIGIMSCTTSDISMETMIAGADTQLYRAKKAGRNQVCLEFVI
ncbi:putative Diguanylate cyclase [uncultured Sporomusa sp.]|uniref:Putative Diguanylate cyclase n=1 Tax=uncultured Sporomusa sp. TaxID=307249 RepID=A0A212LRR6_9FIRM|nr:GGDEF domain-containing protein [uncultured Sporomusa sp.]SCM80232.1 putative Diguanylate cyclase [uncultured Sporomusa sp.]